MSSSVAIIDYGLCNLDSIYRAVVECGGEATITADPQSVARADRCILPGVGAFTQAMINIRSVGLDDAIREHIFSNARPFLGICLGMHLIGDIGEEGEGAPGLKLIPSKIVRLIPADPQERVPHVGWNTVEPTTESPLLTGIKPGTDFYFVHSYHMQCDNDDDIAATTPYCDKLVSVVQHDNIFGTQFHPEKSQSAGFRLIKNFLNY
jgi:glutamine amidotransferase